MHLSKLKVEFYFQLLREKKCYRVLINIGQKAVSDIKAGFLTVQTFVGQRPDYELPNNEQFSSAVEARFEELVPMVVILNTPMAAYEAAIDRVIQGFPPNERKEQFRDSLVLELLIPHALKQTVHFVTRDGDFYEGGKPEKGVAGKLQEELRQKNANLHILWLVPLSRPRNSPNT
jgi:hypothetical protein